MQILQFDIKKVIEKKGEEREGCINPVRRGSANHILNTWVLLGRVYTGYVRLIAQYTCKRCARSAEFSGS